MRKSTRIFILEIVFVIKFGGSMKGYQLSEGKLALKF